MEKISAGGNFSRQKEASDWIDKVYVDLAGGKIDLVVGSANGTFIDAAEHQAWQRHCAGALFYSPKPALGEAVSASGLWQLISAVQALRTQQVPPLLRAPASMISEPKTRFQRAVVSVCGLNQQVGGLLVTQPF
jgi:3-oxoacyl-(acyl-carrier-protein) synthase